MQVMQAKNHEIFINRFLGGTKRAAMVLPDINSAAKEKINKMLGAFEKGHKKIAICLRSGAPFKDWSDECFRNTIKMLAKKYEADFYITGSKHDVAFADKFIENIHGVNIKNFCGATSLAELGWLLKKSDLLLSVDTGTAHIAGAANIPVVVIFGATSAKHWKPYSDKAVCLEPKVDCYPCIGKKIKCSRPICLESIKAEEAFIACCELLDKEYA
jgi:ADP-heptose:LPS heptosyltransferase